MPHSANPTEIAREAFRKLASRRIPPTPDNYREIYAEVSGQAVLEDSFPEKQLRLLTEKIREISPCPPRLERELDEAIRERDWARFGKSLMEYVSILAESRRLSWGEMIRNLFKYWEAKSAHLTPAKKREALEHVLSSSAGNSSTLFARLENLQKTWAQTLSAENTPLTEPEEDKPLAASGIVPTSVPVDALSDRSADLLLEFQGLFAYTVENCIAPLLSDQPRLLEEASKLAVEIRASRHFQELRGTQDKLKHFAFRMELLGEDRNVLKSSLLKLFQLIIENIGELIIDDQWILGQVEAIREIIGKPLSQQGLDDAEQRLKDIIFRQGQLKVGLQEARNALKTMLANFVDHLANFTDATSDYHDKIEGYATKISEASGINDLESILSEVMRETRSIQLSTLRSHDELMQNQKKVQETEERIKTLEKELAETSRLMRHDQLTGAFNRRGLEDVFVKEIAWAERHQTPLCLALLDIDNFKKLNDSLGHDVGDTALIHMTRVIRETLRPQDTVARFGGEEFIVLFPETTLEQGVTAMIRVQRELTRRIFLHQNQKVLITFSAGVAQRAPSETQADLTKRADAAMYDAKQSGKNRVIAAP